MAQRKAQLEVDFRQRLLDEGQRRISKEIDPAELQSLKDELLQIGLRTKELQAKVGDEKIDFKELRTKKLKEIEIEEQRVAAAQRELRSLREDLRVAQKTNEQLVARIIRGEKQQELQTVEERFLANEREKQYRIEKIEAAKKREKEEFLEMKAKKKEKFDEDLFEQKQEQFEKEFEELDAFAARRGFKLKEESSEERKPREEAGAKFQENSVEEQRLKEELKQMLEPGKAKPLFELKKR